MGRKLRVALVVEDEWIILMQLAETLGEAGWSVREADTAELALATLAAEPAIDLLVTDIRLEGDVSGWDLAEAARRANPDVAVIYASANPTDDARMVAGSIFLGKPATSAELLRSVATLCETAG